MIEVHYELRRQRYQDLLREAEEWRLARELGLTEVDTLHAIAASFWNRVSQIISPQVTSSDEALIRRTRSGG